VAADTIVDRLGTFDAGVTEQDASEPSHSIFADGLQALAARGIG
jgi:hypothetical protein